MYKEDYAELFNQLGITEKNQQKKVLEFFYQLGIIVYNLTISDEEKK